LSRGGQTKGQERSGGCDSRKERVTFYPRENNKKEGGGKKWGKRTARAEGETQTPCADRSEKDLGRPKGEEPACNWSRRWKIKFREGVTTRTRQLHVGEKK